MEWEDSPDSKIRLCLVERNDREAIVCDPRHQTLEGDPQLRLGKPGTLLCHMLRLRADIFHGVLGTPHFEYFERSG